MVAPIYQKLIAYFDKLNQLGRMGRMRNFRCFPLKIQIFFRFHPGRIWICGVW